MVDTLIVIPNEKLLADRRAPHDDPRGVPRGRQRPAPGRPGHHRPDHDPRPDQPRLRRRAHDHERRRLGADGHRHRRAARTARSRRPRQAISSPLLEESVEGATGILLNITGGHDLGLFEVNEAAEIIPSAADANANIIFGAVIDEGLQRRGPRHRHRHRLRPAPRRRGARSARRRRLPRVARDRSRATDGAPAQLAGDLATTTSTSRRSCARRTRLVAPSVA